MLPAKAHREGFREEGHITTEVRNNVRLDNERNGWWVRTRLGSVDIDIRKDLSAESLKQGPLYFLEHTVPHPSLNATSRRPWMYGAFFLRGG